MSSCTGESASLWVQVIPAGSTAKFPVVFQASKVQHYQQTVEYVVNGCHIFTFQVHTHNFGQSGI